MGEFGSNVPVLTGLPGMMVNQWYLMQFECYLLEFKDIENEIVDSEGGIPLTDAERLRLYQALFRMLKDKDGNYVFPIPGEFDAANMAFVERIEECYQVLGMPLPLPDNVWNNLFHQGPIDKC